jgi:hypothetical protein
MKLKYLSDKQKIILSYIPSNINIREFLLYDTYTIKPDDEKRQILIQTMKLPWSEFRNWDLTTWHRYIEEMRKYYIQDKYEMNDFLMRVFMCLTFNNQIEYFILLKNHYHSHIIQRSLPNNRIHKE